MPDAPDASVKLRTVLDYLPCEACLSQPVTDQELLCSICRRLDRQVGIRISVRRTVIQERPSEPEPVVIAPPAPAAPAAQELDVVLREDDAPLPDPRPGVPQVVLEPLDMPAAPAAPPEPVEEEIEWEDVASWEPPDDAFEYVRPAAPTPLPPPRVEPVEVPQDAYVFQPPAAAAPPEPAGEPLPAEDWMPAEEVRVEPESHGAWAPPREEASRWSRPAAAPAEPELPQAQVEEAILESTPVEDVPVTADAVEDAPVEMEVVEDAAVEAEIVEDAPPPASNLWRLRGFDRASEDALRAVGVTEILHLAGHDAAELAARAKLPAERLAPWIQVADLAAEGGVPIDAAVALVTAGVAGPKGLRDATVESVIERVHAFAGVDLSQSDVKRWKRRV